MSSTKKITLRSKDGQVFEMDETAALQSQQIKHMIEDDVADNAIPVPNVTGEILAMVVEYCNKHAVAASSDNEKISENELQIWDDKFINVDKATVFELVRTANYLNIKNLYDLACKAVADMIKGKSTEEIRKELHIENDFTPEEEEQIRKENQWAFE